MEVHCAARAREGWFWMSKAPMDDGIVDAVRSRFSVTSQAAAAMCVELGISMADDTSLITMALVRELANHVVAATYAKLSNRDKPVAEIAVLAREEAMRAVSEARWEQLAAVASAKIDAYRTRETAS